MNILFLGYERCKVLDFLKSKYNVLQLSDRISNSSLEVENFDYVISYGYTHILKEDFLNRVKNKPINLHISYLPWNKGYHPNIWSFFEGTPKGVTIHIIDSGIDTGDILFQREVVFDEEDTLQETYLRLRNEMDALFIEKWGYIVSGNYIPIPQSHVGTFHYKKDIDRLKIDDWNMSVKELMARKTEVK